MNTANQQSQALISAGFTPTHGSEYQPVMINEVRYIPVDVPATRSTLAKLKPRFAKFGIMPQRIKECHPWSGWLIMVCLVPESEIKNFMAYEEPKPEPIRIPDGSVMEKLGAAFDHIAAGRNVFGVMVALITQNDKSSEPGANA
jgi:hypothetical protein